MPLAVKNFRPAKAVVPSRLLFAVSVLAEDAFDGNRTAILADRLPGRSLEQRKEMSGGAPQHNNGRVLDAPAFRRLPG
jgi:hypothetical protein